MIHMYVIEFCNALGFKNKKDNRFARIRLLDNRNRINGDFVVSRATIPIETKPGDELIFINKTRSNK